MILTCLSEHVYAPGVNWFTSQKQQLDNCNEFLQAKAMLEKYMKFRILPTTLIQIFCEIILYSKVIIESIIDPGRDLARIFVTGCPNRDFRT